MSDIQNPFFLRNKNRLYISEQLAKEVTILENTGEYSEQYYNKNIENKKLFSDNVRYCVDNRYSSYKVRTLPTGMKLRYGGGYGMNIHIERGATNNNEQGNFYYCVGGYSGDFSMHGKNMIRATKECNLNFIYRLYPFAEKIKNFSKLLYNGESFFDIISNQLKTGKLSPQDISPDIMKKLRRNKLNKLNI